MCRLRNLERLSLCATYFPLQLDIAEIDNEVSHTNLAVSGSRELEIIFFCLKASLTHLYLGDFIWDEMVIYIAEMCKEIELIEFNSTKLTDAAISHLIRRAEHLKALDVSGCSNFTGLAFADCTQETFKATKLKWVQLNLLGHELQMAKDRLSELT